MANVLPCCDFKNCSIKKAGDEKGILVCQYCPDRIEWVKDAEGKICILYKRID